MTTIIIQPLNVTIHLLLRTEISPIVLVSSEEVLHLGFRTAPIAWSILEEFTGGLYFAS